MRASSNNAARLNRLRRRPLGQYRYVRLRWRVLFAAVDFVGTWLFRIARWGFAPAHGLSRRETSVDADPRLILLVQLDHLGDGLITTAMLPALRDRWPQARIEVLASPANRAVFAAAPEVSRVYTCRANRFARRWPDRLGWIAALGWWAWRLRRRRIDLGIDVRGEFPIALLLWLGGAKRRLGWRSGGGGFLLTDSPAFVAGRPEVQSRWALLTELGIHPRPGQGAAPRFRPSDAARRDIRRRLAGQPRGCATASSEAVHYGVQAGHGHCPLVVLHVGAGTPAKRWPAGHWREVAGRLAVEQAARVVLVGGREDRGLGRTILGDRDWPGVRDWIGRLSLDQLAALIEQADLLVGADSGPAHLAGAVGTPTVVLFSGTNDPQQWRPRGSPVTVLRHAVACSPCHRRRCPLAGHPCMRNLRPSAVMAAIDETLRGAGVLPVLVPDACLSEPLR